MNEKTLPCSLHRILTPAGTGGVRKVRWAQKGKGKSGGVRVIYFNRLTDEQIWLLTLYSKSDRSTIPAHELRLIREAIDHE